jgi:hypothetical protein
MKSLPLSQRSRSPFLGRMAQAPALDRDPMNTVLPCPDTVVSWSVETNNVLRLVVDADAVASTASAQLMAGLGRCRFPRSIRSHRRGTDL